MNIRLPREKDDSEVCLSELLEQAKLRACAYVDGVRDQRAFPSDASIEALSALDESLPKEPSASLDVLRTLHRYGSPATVAQTGGRYFGFVTGSSLPAGLAARWLSDVWDQNAMLYVTSPISAHLEGLCERWICELIGLPAGTAAGLVGGTSVATLCGLAAGRGELLRRLRWDVEAHGLSGAPELRVVLSEQTHATVFKALGILGLGRARAERVPADGQGRMRVTQMPTLDDRCLVVAQAGHVNSGAFDPIDEICDRARDAGAWVHVDGAFGLWAAASRAKKHLTRGIEKADSWSADAHKTLNAPYDCGIILCRNRDALTLAMQATAASHIPNSDKRDGMHYTPDMSRRAHGIELWAVLKSLGRAGVEELVERLCSHAQRFAKDLHEEGFRVLNEVVFNQVLVACDTPELTERTLAEIQRSGECWCGGAVWNGEPVIRISVCSWTTTPADVRRSVAAFVAARKAADGGSPQSKS
jgi:glutamate/tyrosine decarboxylase-like PLP-dependent enzyme